MGIKPVGAVKSWTGDPWYPHIKDQMQGVENVGDEGQPNVEAIAALEPDLILGTKMRQEKIYEQLSAIAPTWKDNFKLWANAVDEKEKGDQVLADYDKHVADVKAQIGDKLSTKVSMVRFMPGKARIYYNDTFSGIILKEVGLARPAVQDNPGFSDDVGKERIPDMNGDILFYFTYETGDGEGSKMEKEWTEDKLWKNLEVVKKGNAHRVDDAIWNTAGEWEDERMLSTEKIIDAMSEQGLRITDQRKTLAKLFGEHSGYLSAKDVYEFMGKKYSGLSFDTVYRNLRVMQELGVLEQIVFEDGVKFKASCSEDHHHHHMICLQCEKT
ncbi:hypothetical protein BGX30_007024, partial [Mortierella sp. GBA39]